MSDLHLKFKTACLTFEGTERWFTLTPDLLHWLLPIYSKQQRDEAIESAFRSSDHGYSVKDKPCLSIKMCATIHVATLRDAARSFDPIQQITGFDYREIDEGITKLFEEYLMEHYCDDDLDRKAILGGDYTAVTDEAYYDIETYYLPLP